MGRKASDGLGSVMKRDMPVRIATSIRSRLYGKLRDDSQTDVLLLIPCRDIHTFGMKYALDVAFLDAEGRVISSYRQLLPGKRIRNKHAAAVVERRSVDSEPWFCEGNQVCLSSELNLLPKD